MNYNDAKIAMRALNLDGGEGSGVKGHTTALNKKEEKFVASAVQGAKLMSPGQSAQIDLHQRQIAFREAQNFAARDAATLQTHEELKSYYEGLHDKSISEMRASDNPHKEELASYHEKQKQESAVRHAARTAELKKSIEWHVQLANKLNALGGNS
jgi:hypothetical protein